jgi:hypothetical protein
MKWLFKILSTLGIFIFISCEKEITIDLPAQPSQYVVEGWIEQDQPATVIITKSAPYFDPIDSITLFNSIVQNATVVVSDGFASETLVLSMNPSYFPYIMYMGNTLKGVVGRTYTLNISVDGNTLTSYTTIPAPRYLDSVWFKQAGNNDSLGYIFGKGSDNEAAQDYYRLFTKRIHRDKGFVPMLGSVWEDKYFNGQTFTFQIYRGQASYIVSETPEDRKEFGKFRLGDTVIVKLSLLDYNHYLFWKSYEGELFSGGNPFSNPASIKSNIDGGLGVWGGYGSSYDTIVCHL